ISRLSRSRPSWSVPSRWKLPSPPMPSGGSSRSARLWSCGSKGASALENKAAAMISRTTASPAIALRLAAKEARKPCASMALAPAIGDARIEPEIEQIDREIDQDEAGRGDQD